MLVTKRNGNKEDFNIEKIHRVIEWAVEGLDNVSISDVELKANLSISEGITTKQIQQVMIRSANDLISETNPNYQYVAARLCLYGLRKDVWGSNEPPRLYEHIEACIEKGAYDPEILNWYTKTEIHKINKLIKHDRDDKFTFAGIQQMIDKYLVKNRQTDEIYETPQFAYILVAMTCFAKYPAEKRMQYIKKAYDYISTFKISLPTPIVAGVRTPLRNYSSCILSDIGDSLDSIYSSIHAIALYSSQRSGIGINVGRIRPVNSPVRNGEIIHTGLIPFLKVIEGTIKSVSQGGLRGSSGTVNFPIWHYECPDMVVLKDNGGTDDNRVRKLDYVVQISKLFYERLKNNENITLLSPAECPGLYEAFGLPEFDELYLKYEKNTKLKFRKKIKAANLFEIIFRERIQTGRIYIMNIDHCNEHGSFTEQVSMTNLCVTGDTKVYCERDGYLEHIRIDDIVKYFEAGEKINILSRNEQEDTLEYKQLTLAGKTRENAELVLIKDLVTGVSLTCTADHLIYTKNRGYVRADELTKEDKLFLAGVRHSPLQSTKVSVVKLFEKEDVYDITVADNHNFFANHILVHNCVEVTHPTKPIVTLNDEHGYLGVCLLAAVNMLETKEDEYSEVCDIIVRIEDAIIDHQQYPVKAAENFCKKYRSIGIGFTNLAGFLAKNKLRYDDPESLKLIHKYAELLQYNLLDASAELAGEKGACENFHLTKYAAGILPIDTYKKSLDKVVNVPLNCDWELLREKIKRNGLRNSTLTSQMPCESSSLCTNSTNGIEPVRSLISVKKSKTGLLKQVVPNFEKFGKFYQKAFDNLSNKCYSDISATIQKFWDMAISTNHFYDYKQFEGGSIPLSTIAKDVMYAYSVGVKCLYYANTNDGDVEVEMKQDKGCESGACTL
jgi:ribonucleotide reductase alpha subunit